MIPVEKHRGRSKELLAFRRISTSPLERKGIEDLATAGVQSPISNRRFEELGGLDEERSNRIDRLEKRRGQTEERRTPTCFVVGGGHGTQVASHVDPA